MTAQALACTWASTGPTAVVVLVVVVLVLLVVVLVVVVVLVCCCLLLEFFNLFVLSLCSLFLSRRSIRLILLVALYMFDYRSCSASPTETLI